VKIEKKHSFASRWMHWINFPLLSLMIWSGLLIYWANDVYEVRLVGFELFHFFPESFYDFLGIDHRLAEGMSIHFFVMWFFAINGLLYVAYLSISGEWRGLAPTVRSFKEAVQVALYDLHLSSYRPPQKKYNSAQRVSYSIIVLMGGGSVLTGLAIYKPIQLGWLTAVFGGYEWARWVHFWLTIGFVGFFVIHVAQVIRAGWNNFSSMVTGYEYVEGAPETDHQSVPVSEHFAGEGGIA